MAKLAVIGKIISLESIPGADRIQLATVVCGDAGKWNGVVGLNHHAGERVLVFLQDAVLPADDERWEFMEKFKWRVRMARFKGVPSECVIVHCAADLPVGTDVAEELGVTKYFKVLPESMAGDAVGDFPSFIPKTDEPNFQTIADLQAIIKANAWTARIKYDGSSCTAWNDEDQNLHVASRNLELREFNAKGAGNAYWRAARKYDLSALPAGCALQFEVVGPGIQGNPLGLTEVEARAFTLYDFVNHKRRGEVDLVDACQATGVPIATAQFMFGSGEEIDSEALRRLAEVKYPSGKTAEGLVFRNPDHSVSFKTINLLYKERD